MPETFSEMQARLKREAEEADAMRKKKAAERKKRAAAKKAAEEAAAMDAASEREELVSSLQEQIDLLNQRIEQLQQPAIPEVEIINPQAEIDQIKQQLAEMRESRQQPLEFTPDQLKLIEEGGMYLAQTRWLNKKRQTKWLQIQNIIRANTNYDFIEEADEITEIEEMGG